VRVNLSTPLQIGPGDGPTSCKGVSSLFLEIKRLEHGDDHQPPSSVGFRMGRRCISIPMSWVDFTTLAITGTSLFCSFLLLNPLINSLLSTKYQLYFLGYLTILGKIFLMFLDKSSFFSKFDSLVESTSISKNAWELLQCV
jgi:hypothetical protein